jgi:hypothetical protein
MKACGRIVVVSILYAAIYFIISTVEYILGVSTYPRYVKGGRDTRSWGELVLSIAGEYKDFKSFERLFMERETQTIETVDQLEYMRYESSSRVVKIGDHIGQRKLFLNELQFLTKCTKHKYCIYPGSSPGHKTYYLSSLFPHMKLILVDPNEFDLKLPPNNTSHRNMPHPDIVHLYHNYPTESKVFMNKKISDMTAIDKKKILDFISSSSYKIYIIEDYMNNDYAQMFKPLNAVFISDIRSNISYSSFPMDFDIYWNSSMMFNWITIMQPQISMLKIRMPYRSDSNKEKWTDKFADDFSMSKVNGIDFISDYLNNKYSMPKSVLYVQPWGGRSTSEVRMYINKKDLSTIVEYDIDDIEGKMFYFNSINRPWVLHDNKYASRKLNFCYCNDCSLESKIWRDYFESINVEPTGMIDHIHKAVINLGVITDRPLKHVHKVPLWDKKLDTIKSMIEKGVQVHARETKKLTKKKKGVHLGDAGTSSG